MLRNHLSGKALMFKSVGLTDKQVGKFVFDWFCLPKLQYCTFGRYVYFTSSSNVSTRTTVEPFLWKSFFITSSMDGAC